MKRVMCTMLAGLLAAPMAFGQADPVVRIVDVNNTVRGQAVLSDGRLYNLNINVDRTEDGNSVFGTKLPDDACVNPGVCAIANEFTFDGGGGFIFFNTELARSEYAIGANVQTARVNFFSNAIGEQVDARWTRSGPIGENSFSNKITPPDGAGLVLHEAFSNQSATASIQVNSSGPLLTSMGGGFLSKSTNQQHRIILP